MRIADMRAGVRPGLGASRRQALTALAGAGLGVWQAPTLASKKTRKAVKRARKQGDRKCRRQDGQCVQAMTDLCNRNGDPADAAACITKFSACCAFLGDCQAGSYLDCTFAA